MKHLLPLILLLCLLLRAHADEWRSEEYGVALTTPSNEPWQRGSAAKIPAGDVVFFSTNMDSKQCVAIVRIPDLPTNDVQLPAMVARLKETLVSLGFTAVSASPLVWKESVFVQFIARRSSEVQAKTVCVARATIRENIAYLVLTYGRGSEDSLQDKDFTRVVDSFRFIDPGEFAPADLSPMLDPLFRKNRMTYRVCLAVVGVLICIFTGMMLGTRRRHF